MRKNTWLETITALAFLFFVGIILYYSLWPFKVTTLNSVGIDSAEYCRGDWANIELDFTKHMDIEGKVTWYIVDGIIYELDSPGISRGKGENHVVISKQVPNSILPGKYNFRVRIEYAVHPLHAPIVLNWNTPDFEVLDCGNEGASFVFQDPVSRPVVEQEPQSQPVIVPIEQTTTIITEEGQESTEVSQPDIPESTPEPKPLKELLDTVLSPVQGLLKP